MALLLTSCAEPAPDIMRKHCISDSGQSEYFFEIQPSENNAVFRYRYLGQDVSYQTTQVAVIGDLVTGEARFEDAASGEVRGRPVTFSYNWATEVFDDGFANFQCTTLQDASLLKLPKASGIDGQQPQ